MITRFHDSNLEKRKIICSGVPVVEVPMAELIVIAVVVLCTVAAVLRTRYNFGSRQETLRLFNPPSLQVPPLDAAAFLCHPVSSSKQPSLRLHISPR